MTPDRSKAPADDRRQGPREWAGEIQPAVVGGLGQPPRQATARNLGPGGIRLSLDYESHPGALLELDLRRPGRAGSCRIQATVVYVVAAGEGRFITGCAFLRPLSDAELRLLL